jgi:hypothetical protein
VPFDGGLERMHVFDDGCLHVGWSAEHGLHRRINALLSKIAHGNPS